MHDLDTVIAERHLLNHPFYQRWMAGTLSKEELAQYAVNYYPHVLAFPTYVSSVHAQCNNISLRQALLENLIEEERGEKNHPELWLRFGEALGLSRDKIEGGACLPEAAGLVDTFRKLTRKSLASGLGALYAYESQVPAVAAQKIAGLRENYGITEQRGLEFFSVHLAADEHHSRTERDAISSLSPAEQTEALEAAREASQALWDFLSALDPGVCSFSISVN